MRVRIVIVLAGAGLAALLSGCGGSGASGTSGTRLNVVASTNVYGDIAEQIGGRHVHVTSILSDPNADPHLFEPGTSNGLAVAQATVVIQNGVGYDAFMTKLEQAAPSSKRRVLTIADVLDVHGHDANPHLWYDVPKLPAIARSIARALTQADPSHAAAYAQGEHRFVTSLAPLNREVATIRRAHPDAPVAYTEPVPGYLLIAAGLRNLAPSGFTRAIENGSEPAPQDVAAMNELISKHRVKVLLYNDQAVSPITARVRDEAQRAGVPVIGVSETLPPHRTFQQWQLGQARALAHALG
jgi:zinc/manganese transport system substrate-binding protein